MRILLMFALLLHACVHPSLLEASPAPKKHLIEIPGDVLFRPSFLMADITHFSGTAFRIQFPAGSKFHYLVTAHSLLGPAAGLSVQMRSEEISRVINAVIGLSCDHTGTLVLARKHIPTPDARATDRNGSEKDIALFAIERILPGPASGIPPNCPALELNPLPPNRGERVYIYLRYPGKITPQLEPATIASTTGKELLYVLDNPSANLAESTGAPLLDKNGKVIGMHIHSRHASNARILGAATPAAAILKILDPAWSPPPRPPIFRD